MRFSRMWLSAIATAVIAAPIAAQNPQQDVFKFNGSKTGAPEIDGTPISAYDGSFKSIDNFGTLVDVWCVDFDSQILKNNKFDVWVTPMTTGDWSKTKLGADYANNYRWAAFFAADFDWWTADQAPDDEELQEALWYIMGYNANWTSTDFDNFISTNYGGLVGTDWTATAPPESRYGAWWVITQDNCEAGSNLSDDECKQELIYFDPSRPQETVPEPATMTLLATGLAGLAGARRRAKNKKS